MAITTFKAESRWAGGLQVDNTARDFSIRIDEPVNIGGADTGMTPMEAQLTAFGSCLTIVAAAFAKDHQIDLQEFWLELEGDIDTDGFFFGKPGVRNGFQEIRVIPHLKTSSSNEDVDKFMEFIESRCPVSDNLANDTKISRAKPVYL